jgi:hypothetical protein
MHFGQSNKANFVEKKFQPFGDLYRRTHVSWLAGITRPLKGNPGCRLFFARGCSHLYRERPTSCRASYGFTTLAVNGLAHRSIFHFKLSGRVFPMAPNSS